MSFNATFIKRTVHRSLVRKICEEAKRDHEVSGLLLQGSVNHTADFSNHGTEALDKMTWRGGEPGVKDFVCRLAGSDSVIDLVFTN